jgi:ribose transport system permease protein
VLTVAVVVGFAIQTGGTWISHANMASVLQVTATIGIMALGEALVITAREVDISVGSVFGIGALVYLGAAPTVGALAAVVAAVAAGAAIGAFNGLLVTRFKVSALIATLGSLFIFRGLCYWLTEGFSFTAGDDLRQSAVYSLFGGGDVFGFKDSVIWLVVVAAALHLAIFATPFGNRLLATGGSEASAVSRGVDTLRLKFIVFLIAGALAAFAGVLEASKIGSADGSFGRLQELQAIAACVVGGCVLTGGRCSVVGVVMATFVLTGIQSFLVLNSVEPQWFLILLGALILAAMIFDRGVRRLALRG